jgi:hypothetical protein
MISSGSEQPIGDPDSEFLNRRFADPREFGWRAGCLQPIENRGKGAPTSRSRHPFPRDIRWCFKPNAAGRCRYRYLHTGLVPNFAVGSPWWQHP